MIDIYDKMKFLKEKLIIKWPQRTSSAESQKGINAVY